MSGSQAPTGRSRRVVVAGVVAAAIVVALIIWLVARDDGSPSAGDDPAPSGSADPSSNPTSTSTSNPTKLPTQITPTASPPPTKIPKPIRVRLGAQAELGNGVEVQVTRIESVMGVARGPGEVAGPSLRFTVEVVNGSAREINLDLVVITVYYGVDAAPASDLSGPGVVALPQRLAAGRSASGRACFRHCP